MTLTAMAMQPRSCPCCWDRKNGCLAECMPFSVDTGGAFPSMDGAWDCCLSNALASWASASASEVCTKIRDNGGNSCVYATAETSISECSDASWQALQYCVEDAEGTNGRAWIVDLLIRIGTGPGSVTTLTSRVLDWVCTCDGARFEWSVTGDIPDCPADIPLCDDGCPECYTIVSSGFAGSEGGSANGTFVLRRSPCSATCWTYDDGTYRWLIDKSAFFWKLSWGTTSIVACQHTSRWWESTISVPSDCTAPVVFNTGGITPAGASHISSAPTSITATPSAC